MAFLDKVNNTENGEGTGTEIGGITRDAMDSWTKAPPGIVRSMEMQALMKDKLEANLGNGMWGDEIASVLARDLDARVVYEPRIGIEGRDETRIGFDEVKVVEEEDDEEEEVKERVMTGKKTSLGRVRSRPGSVGKTKRPNTMYGRRTEKEQDELDEDEEDEEDKERNKRPKSQPMPNSRILKREVRI